MLKEIFEILKKRSKKVYIFMFSIFFLFFFFALMSSRYLAETDPDKIDYMLQQIKESPTIQNFYDLMKEEKFLDISLLIFLHNSQIAIINYVFGTTFLFPIIIQISNALIIGFLLGVSEKIFVSHTDILAFSIVFLLEVISITLTAVEGMYVTYTFLRPEKMWKTKDKKKAVLKTIKQSAKIVLFVIFLLLIASIVETLSIYFQYKATKQAFIIGV